MSFVKIYHRILFFRDIVFNRLEILFRKGRILDRKWHGCPDNLLVLLVPQDHSDLVTIPCAAADGLLAAFVTTTTFVHLCKCFLKTNKSYVFAK